MRLNRQILRIAMLLDMTFPGSVVIAAIQLMMSEITALTGVMQVFTAATDWARGRELRT